MARPQPSRRALEPTAWGRPWSKHPLAVLRSAHPAGPRLVPPHHWRTRRALGWQASGSSVPGGCPPFLNERCLPYPVLHQ